MDLDDECDLHIADPDVVQLLDRHVDENLAHRRILDPERWADRRLLQRVGESLPSVVGRRL